MLSVEVLSASIEHRPCGSGAAVATNLRAARLAAGLSQEALGDACNLHRTEVSLLEGAGREPRLRTITKLARALDLRPAALLEHIE